MKVKELIEKLQKVDQDAEVTTWDAYTDCETWGVCLSQMDEGKF
ncbi:hypothetical protein [uncultured Desulfuromusa sp.]|nr:hypothetical protein [uncultured Desulfuromusa sp.]